MYIHIHTCMHIIQTYIIIYNICTCTYIHKYVHMYTCMYVPMHTYIYTCTLTCVHTYEPTYVHTYIHTRLRNTHMQLHTVQLKGNLTPARGQWVQHPRVILVRACGCLLGYSLCRAKPACNECGFFKIPARAVYYQAYHI